MIWASQVLAPFSISGTIHAFLDLFPTASKKPERLSKFFPCYRSHEPQIFKDKAYELGFTIAPRCGFRDFPSRNNKAYIKWLYKVEKKKRRLQRDQEIYDLIQLSRISIKCNPNMLITDLIIWEGSTNNFHLRYGMVTPEGKGNTRKGGLYWVSSLINFRFPKHHKNNNKNNKKNDKRHKRFILVHL